MSGIKIEPFCDYNVQKCSLGRHKWSIPRLVELSKDLEVFEIPLRHLNIYQSYDKMTLRELVGHIMSVQAANLDYPIILDEDGDLMDGRHRIMRAILEGREAIKAVRFESNPRPCEIEEA